MGTMIPRGLQFSVGYCLSRMRIYTKSISGAANELWLFVAMSYNLWFTVEHLLLTVGQFWEHTDAKKPSHLKNEPLHQLKPKPKPKLKPLHPTVLYKPWCGLLPKYNISA